MTKTIAKTGALLLALLSVWACESDLDKLNRLQLEVSTARLEVLMYERGRDSIADELGEIPSALDTSAVARDFWAVMDSLSAVQNRGLLAQRDLNGLVGR